jgi:hypothetical protein
MKETVKDVNKTLKALNLKELVVPVDDESKMELIESAMLWLFELKVLCNRYKEYKALLPKEIWDRYEMWGDFEQHAECRLVSGVKKQIRSRMQRNKHAFFKKAKLKKKNAKGKVQSCKTSSDDGSRDASA